MTNIYQFMSDSPWLSFFIGIFVVVPICLAPFRLLNRLFRHLNVRARGWPPAHLDADGDWKPEPDSET